MEPTVEEKKEVFALIIRSLEKYPSPVPFRLEAKVHYVPPISFASGAYAQFFQGAPEEEKIRRAFAGALPKVAARTQDLIARGLNAIADGTPAPTCGPEYLSLLGDLSAFASMFVNVEGFAPHYGEVCALIKRLSEF